MPYSSNADVPDAVKKRLKTAKKISQWRAIFNSSYKKYNDEGRAFRIANGTVKSKGYLSSWDAEVRQVPQDVANYSATGMSGDKACANCQWYVSPNSCVIVSGDISPTGLSALYTKKVEYNTPPLLVRVVDDDYEEATPTVSFLGAKARGLWGGLKAVLGLEDKQAPKTFTLFEDNNGDLRFFVAYSNIFQDSHKEILSTDAHKEYVAWATKSKIYPELQIWHCGSGSKYGQCDFVDFVDGFCVASGVIDEDKHDLAYAIEATNPGASHSFVGIKASEGSGVWDIYRTFEISTLPVDHASNGMLDVLFAPGTKEYEMPFEADKRAVLLGLGLDEATIDKWQNDIQQQTALLKAAGVEFKSTISPTADSADAAANNSNGAANSNVANSATTDGAGATTSNSGNPTAEFATKSELAFFGKAHAESAAALAGIVGSMNTLTTQVKQLAQTVEQIKKPIDQQVAEQFTAKTGPATAGVFVATQSKDNSATQEEQAKAAATKDNWYDMVMDQAAKALGAQG